MERSAQAPDLGDGPDPPLAFARISWVGTPGTIAIRIGHFPIEILQLMAAALTTIAAASRAAQVLTAALASLTLLVTGLRQVFGFREKWATMTRATVRIDAIVAEETQGWAERLRTSGRAASDPTRTID